MRSLCAAAALVLSLCLLSPGAPVSAQPAPAAPQAADTAAGGSFDPVAATEAWLARMPPAERARSDAYFEGGYWLQLWDFLYGLAVFGLLLRTGLSAGMRDRAERWIPWRPLQTFLYAVQFIVAVGLLTFPLAVYEGFFREHQYGLSNQTFGGWLRDQGVGFGLAIVLGGLAVTGLYAVLRRAPRTWWLWGAVFGVLFLSLGLLIAPVFVEPLFNDFSELTDPAVRGPILSLARANGIPADHVYVYDASKQSKRVSAHVSGFLGTTQISLNDNLLKRMSLPAVEAVMAHEMGHYVLHHVNELLESMGLVLFAGFLFLRWSFDAANRRWGRSWGVHGIAGIAGISDMAGLPLLAALFSTYLFLMTPVLNTIVRTNEAEADIFGLNAARQPDGFAEASLLLGEYRKLSPGPLEEVIFFDHPSGRNRILMAMRWKAEQGLATGNTPAPEPHTPPPALSPTPDPSPALPPGGARP
jgi:STE24 endopeptidase